MELELGGTDNIMKELIEKLESLTKETPNVTEMRMDQIDRRSLADFQRLSAKATEQIGLAYNSILALKGAYDTFEEIPNAEQKRYGSLQPMLSKLGKLKQDMYNIEMQLKRKR